MVIFLWLAALALVAVALLSAFTRGDPGRIARAIRRSVPVAKARDNTSARPVRRPVERGAGRLSETLGLATKRPRGRPRPAAGSRSMVRTAVLEMELDHDTGRLEGLVLAGSHDGKVLGALGLRDLLRLYEEMQTDPDSCRLLETYLDGRFPVWRQHVKAHRGERLGVAPGAGAMTKEEAYQILGLEAGAAAADVRKAHRRLMQRLNPDVGATSFLAARIDQAKNVLLSDHH